MTHEHTQGKWNYFLDGDNTYKVNSGSIDGICDLVNTSQTQNEANARLIADAGTTANACGLLPSELLQQRNELLKALQEVLAYEKRGADKGEPRIGNGILNIIRTAIEKSTQQ